MSDGGGNKEACAIPMLHDEQITMLHGGGGAAMHRLIDKVFMPSLGNESLRREHDAAVFSIGANRLAFTTDSFVVQPLVFPGGDIGSLSVYGTVNDLAMAGARPLYLSAAFILESGLPVSLLREVVESMKRAADSVGVSIVTGDTKVIERSRGDGMFINTAGVGVVQHGLDIAPQSVMPGDAIIVSGDTGRHGIAIMAVREGLEFETELESDCAPLVAPVLEMLELGIRVRCLRDLTRGGLTSALNEIAAGSGLGAHITELKVPVRPDVRGACELLGLDPFSVANEGRFVVYVHPADVSRALDILRCHAADTAPAWIGSVLDKTAPVRVTLESSIGSVRILDMPSGEQLPRIC